MTLQELGSLGEFVAAIGLMFSLTFVGIEIRKTRKQHIVEGVEKRLDLFNDFNRLLLTNAELRDVWTRSYGDLTEFSPDELFIYGHLMTLRFTIFARMFVRGSELNDRDSLGAARALLRDQFSGQPNAINWWQRSRNGWRTKFRKFVDDVLREQESTSS